MGVGRRGGAGFLSLFFMVLLVMFMWFAGALLVLR